MSTHKNKFIRIISFTLLALFLFQVGAQAATRSDVKQIIIQEAQNSRVPASLALAVAKVESDFLEDALSSAGARGVMQIMPIMMTLFFLWFPAGLVLYWLTNALLGILQQWYTTRKIEAAYEAGKRVGL